LKIAQAITVFILSALVLGLTFGTASATMQKYGSNGGNVVSGFESGYTKTIKAFHPFMTEVTKIGKTMQKYGAKIKKPNKTTKHATVIRGGTFGMSGVESGGRYAGRGPGMGLGYKITPPNDAPGPYAVPFRFVKK
jgi:hypothetical protein